MVGRVEVPEAAENGTLVLSDRRRLGYAQYGKPDGKPLFYFHGHPGSRLEGRFAHAAAAEAGFRVIALGSRWPALAGALARSIHRGISERPQRTIDALARAMSASDAEIVRRPEVREILIADITDAFRQDSRGAAWDIVLLGRPWGFALREIKPEVHLWQGEADTLVPPAMGRYQASQIPRSHLRLFPGQGHLLIIDRMPDHMEAFR
jgi:pimeloyl-ACP methyl ester carboxylesterase